MGNYPSQLVAAVCSEIPIKLKAYMEQNAQNPDSFLYGQTLEGNVTQILEEWFSEELIVDIDEILPTLQASRRQRRLRMKQKFMKLCKDNSENEAQHPLYFLAQQRMSLFGSQWEKLYSGRTYEEIKNSWVESMLNWAGSPEEPLIACPFLISCVRSSQLPVLFISDLKYEIALCIRARYKGNLRNFFKSYPTDLIDQPLFAPSGTELIMRQIGKTLQEDFILEESGDILRTTIRAKRDTVVNEAIMIDDLDDSQILYRPYKALDERARLVMSYLLDNLGSDFYQTRSVVVDATELIDQMVDSKKGQSGYGSWYYQVLEEICADLSDIRYEVLRKNGEELESLRIYNLFDNVGYDRTGNRILVNATFGSLLYRAIVDNRLVRVTADNYNALENKMSKLLFFMIQRERIALSEAVIENGLVMTDELMTKEYNLSYFKSVVRFRYKQPGKNMTLIKEALEEFISVGIAIKSYTETKNKITITYLPLTQEEVDDLTFKTVNIN